MLTLPKHMASYVTIEEVEYVNPSETHGIILGFCTFNSLNTFFCTLKFKIIFLKMKYWLSPNEI